VSGDNNRQLDVMRWGLVPARSKSIGSKPWFNGRSEQLHAQGGAGNVYRRLIGRKRCLVPFDAFYEWHRLPDGGKQPFAVSLDGDGPHAFAGVWDEWDNGDEVLRSCLMFTCKANSLMAYIHNGGPRGGRMPVILSPDRWGDWLSEDVTGQEAARLLKPWADDHSLVATPVSDSVSRGVESEMCLEPVGQPIRTVPDSEPRLFGGDA
jgi:putative SOS response-associated peptidase YedK